MGFTRSERDVKIIQKLSDYPNVEDGVPTEELKKKFDQGAEIVQEDLNKFISEIEVGSASKNIGADPLDENDVSEGNVLAKLKKIHEEAQNMALGQIPDGTITKAKMNEEYEKTLAKKDGELQEGLNAEMFNGENKEEFLANNKPYVVGFYEGNAESDDYTVRKIELPFTPQAVYVRVVAGSTANINLFAITGSPHYYDNKVEARKCLEIVENGFNVKNISAGGTNSWINTTGHQYNYIAFK